MDSDSHDFQVPFRSGKCCQGQCCLRDWYISPGGTHELVMCFEGREMSAHWATLGRSGTLEYIYHLTGNSASVNLARGHTFVCSV